MLSIFFSLIWYCINKWYSIVRLNGLEGNGSYIFVCLARNPTPVVYIFFFILVYEDQPINVCNQWILRYGKQGISSVLIWIRQAGLNASEWASEVRASLPPFGASVFPSPLAWNKPLRKSHKLNKHCLTLLTAHYFSICY